MSRQEQQDYLQSLGLVQDICNRYFPRQEPCPQCKRDYPSMNRRYDSHPLYQSLEFFSDILYQQRGGYYCNQCGCGKFMRKPKPSIPSGWKRRRSSSPKQLPQKQHSFRRPKARSTSPKRSKTPNGYKSRHVKQVKQKRSKTPECYASPRYSPSSSRSPSPSESRSKSRN